TSPHHPGAHAVHLRTHYIAPGQDRGTSPLGPGAVIIGLPPDSAVHGPARRWKTERSVSGISPMTDHDFGARVPKGRQSPADSAAAAVLEGRSSRRGISRILPFLGRSEEHTSELQSRFDLVCRLLLE